MVDFRLFALSLSSRNETQHTHVRYTSQHGNEKITQESKREQDTLTCYV